MKKLHYVFFLKKRKKVRTEKKNNIYIIYIYVFFF